jgi:GR25 family glycosyltransferase involved in LPS biosynthesis
MQKGATKSISRHQGKESPIHFEGFVLDDQGNRGRWESVWDSEVTSLTMLDPIRPDDKMLNDSLNDGTISRRYKSWYMPGGPASGEKKFYHEIGVTMAHRSAWKAFLDRAGGDNNRYGLIFEGDAILRADLWRWMRHLKNEVLNKGSPPMMVWLGHCYESCYQKQDPQFRDGDFCLEGAENNNPHNVSGCYLHFQQAICPVAYLISRPLAETMMKITTPMNCAVDEKFRYELQKNNWDSRVMCQALARQPWQHELEGEFTTKAGLEAEMKQQGYLHLDSDHAGRLVGETRDANICEPPGDWVRTITSWP